MNQKTSFLHNLKFKIVIEFIEMNEPLIYIFIIFLIFLIFFKFQTCSICLEAWTNSGIHRIVCLKCGHLFGEGCIERWLKSVAKCPQCNRPSKRTDIRRIYAKSIKVIDTAELDKALKDLDGEKQIRKKAEIEASEIKLRFQLVRDELSIMQQKYNSLLQKLNNHSTDFSSNAAYTPKSALLNSDCSNSFNFCLEKLINLTEVWLRFFKELINFFFLS